MSKLYLVSRDTVMSNSGNKFVPYLFEVQRPCEYLVKNHGAVLCTQKEFFDNYCDSLSEEDIVVLFISIKEEDRIQKLSACKAKKLLRAIDPSKSDKVLFKKPLELHDQVGFDGFVICYPNKEHISYLEERGLKVLVWAHSLDFSNSSPIVGMQKTGVWISAGQQHEKFYPCRWNLTKILVENFGNEGVLLPHPGYDTDNLRHPYVGEKFLDFISNFIFMPVGIGINDGFHMKFIEAAHSNVLPIGTVPSYLPDDAREIIPFSNLDPENYNTEDVVKEMRRLLSEPQELIAKIRDWKSWVSTYHNLQIVQEGFIKQIEAKIK